jgi:hypothetical protein
VHIFGDQDGFGALLQHYLFSLNFQGASMRYLFQFILPVLLGGACLLSLSGCANSTIGGVRGMGSDRQFTFVAPENYQPVYRKILDQTIKCYPHSYQLVVERDIFTDTKSGTISVRFQGPVSAAVMWVIDLSALDEKQTKVVGYFAYGSPDKKGQILKEWVLENLKEKCF